MRLRLRGRCSVSKEQLTSLRPMPKGKTFIAFRRLNHINGIFAMAERLFGNRGKGWVQGPFRIAQFLLACILLIPSNCGFAQSRNLDDPKSDTALNSSALSYHPITDAQRLKWIVESSIGPRGIAAGVVSAGVGTARDRPIEYDAHWEGFGKRYGMRLTGIATGNVMEAALGAIWKEDPRYFPSSKPGFTNRIKNILVMTVAARRGDGHLAPAYARYIAIPGNNFLSNSWRARSESGISDAGLRTMWGLLGRFGSNAFQEFWPDFRKHLFHGNDRGVTGKSGPSS